MNTNNYKPIIYVLDRKSEDEDYIQMYFPGVILSILDYPFLRDCPAMR